MRKGLIFSADAILATIFVVALAAAFAFYYIAGSTHSVFLENLNHKTTDAAIIAFYLKQTTVAGGNYTDFNAIRNSLGNESFSKCAQIYEYTLQNDDPNAAQRTITPLKYCRGFG
ncbi:MAG: hypothetical protein HYW50_03310 [Candidatus Diapherotrites archaeon]|nr:hypothetical protein [Candidatus Diapherotrites archaeon]